MARIAFYAPLKPPDHPVPSGDRMMARALIAALTLAGHEVTIVSRFRTYDAGDPARQTRLRDAGARLVERLLRRFARAASPELWFTYHLYHKAPDWLGPAVAARLRIPYFVVEASFAPKQAGGKWDLGHRAVADAIGRADRVFQPNPLDAECVRPLLRSQDRLVLLRPFLDVAQFRGRGGIRAQARAHFARAHGLDPQEPLLLTVAMMRADQKLASYRCLADALSELQDLPWRLIIAGEGPAEPQVRAAFARLGERTVWFGALDRGSLRRLYEAADLFVWPAIKEAWGMALLEAQAAGLPVVAGRSSGVATIIADRETGLLPPMGDAGTFAAAVRSLLLDPRSLEQMRAAALRRTECHHDIRVAAELLDTHIRAAIGPPGS